MAHQVTAPFNISNGLKRFGVGKPLALGVDAHPYLVELTHDESAMKKHHVRNRGSRKSFTLLRDDEVR